MEIEDNKAAVDIVTASLTACFVLVSFLAFLFKFKDNNSRNKKNNNHGNKKGMTTLNLASLLSNSASKDPQKIALVIGETKLSYQVLDGMARKVASMLKFLDIDKGMNVALMLPNVPQFVACYYGALYRGSAMVPLNVLLKGNEVSYHLEDSDAQVLVVWEGFLKEGKAGFDNVNSCKHLIVVPTDPKNTEPIDGALNFNALLANTKEPIPEFASTNPDDTAVILYTSGTTGPAKGAELSHFNLFQNAQYTTSKLVPLTPNDVGLATLPLFHSFAQTVVMNGMIAIGGTIVLLPRFDPEACLKLMQANKVTFFAGVPTMYFALLHHPKAEEYDLSSLRFCVAGGSPMPMEVMKAFDKKYNVNILEGYGLSETSPVASFNVLDRPKKIGSIGVPIDYVQFRLVDEKGNTVVEDDAAVVDNKTPGEICIKGCNVMKGYYKKPEATKAAITSDGWFATGDIATRDADGYYFIVDRKKDMLIRGGNNVYPREIEEVLYQHEAIAEAAVIGIPDDKYGEEVKAVVALKPGMTAKEEEIIEYCKTKLAAYKYPRVVEVVESLPKGPTGKILKRMLRRHHD